MNNTNTSCEILRARRIRELRKSKKLTQPELADILHVARNTVYTWERAPNPMQPNLDALVTMSQLFNVSTDYLLGLTIISSRAGETLEVPDTESNTKPLLRTGKVIDELVKKLAARNPDIVLLFAQEFSDEELDMIEPTLQAVMKYREAMKKAKAARATIPITEHPEVGVEKRADSAG